MARRTCILCERDLFLLGKCVIDLHGTKQSLCGECKRVYEKCNLEEKFVLWEKMLRSSSLEDYETVRAGVAAARGKWEESQVKRQNEQELIAKKRAMLESNACCCDMPMTLLGERQFQLGEYTLFGGDLNHLEAGSLTMAIYRCECCGQLKFFDPEILSKLSKQHQE